MEHGQLDPSARAGAGAAAAAADGVAPPRDKATATLSETRLSALQSTLSRQAMTRADGANLVPNAAA